ncbi:hypothetical protein ACHAWF_012913 [Thalassiosira exigua]
MIRSAIAIARLLLVLAAAPGLVQGGKTSVDDVDLTLDALAAAKQRYYDLLAAFDDDDEDAPPGPPGGWPHLPAFSTTLEQQREYNDRFEEEVYAAAHELYFQSYGGKDARGIRVNQIARPEGATTGYYTGVAHFRHVNDPDLATFLFSNGRHDGGTNTYLTVDTSVEGNPFAAAQESFVDADDVSTYTWVSTYTVAERDGPAHHYALFSGGSGGGAIGPSKMYLYEEDYDGTLRLPPRLVFAENLNDIAGSARYCLLADLGDLYDGDGDQVSIRGLPDVLITGTGGLNVYSALGRDEWRRTRSIRISDSDDTVAFLGVEVLGDYLIVAARTAWKLSARFDFDAPCLVYDYVNEEMVQRFAGGGQTVSVAVLDGGSRVLVGAGGQTSYSGQPNLMFDAIYEEEDRESRYPKYGRLKGKSVKNHTKKRIRKDRRDSKAGKGHKPPADETLSLELSETQLALGMPRNYASTERVDPVPVSSQEYFVVPSPGTTRTRQVSSFRIDDVPADLVLEVNSAQACNVYYREAAGEPSSRVMPLPGSEGAYTESGNVYARGGDALLVGDRLYVILAMYNGNNTVYSFGIDRNEPLVLLHSERTEAWR